MSTRVGFWNYIWEPGCDNTSNNVQCVYRKEIECCKHTRFICIKPKEVNMSYTGPDNKGCVFRDREYKE